MLRSTFFYLLLGLFVFAGCSKDDSDDSTNGLKACFSHSGNDGTVSFNSDCSSNANEYYWDFGNGGTSINPNPTHTYSNPGNYQVSLRVTDLEGQTNTETKTVNVREKCIRCTCTFSIMGTTGSSDDRYCSTGNNADDWEDSFRSACSGSGYSVNCY